MKSTIFCLITTITFALLAGCNNNDTVVGSSTIPPSDSQWVQISNGIPTSEYVYSFAASGSNLFAGTMSNGIFLSKNNNLKTPSY